MRTFVSHFLFTYLFLFLFLFLFHFPFAVCASVSVFRFSLRIFVFPFSSKRRQFSMLSVCYWLCATIFIFNLVDFPLSSYLTWTISLRLFHFCECASIVLANFPWHQILKTNENVSCTYYVVIQT